MTKLRRALLLGAILVVGCGGCRLQPPVELLLTGGQVVTLDSAHPAARSVGVSDGRIVEVDGRRAGATVLDLGGAVVAPALVDHQIHLFNVGLWLLNDRDRGRLFLDLTAVSSLDKVADLVRARAAALPAGTWIVGAGWNQASWGTQSLPSHDVLSRAAPHHPVFLARTDGHAGWVNANALALARVQGSSGMLLERANEPVIAPMPALPDSDIVSAYRLAAQALAVRGVVEVYDAGALAFPGVVALNADLGRSLALLRRADSVAPLPIRVNLMVPAPSRLADSLLDSDHSWALSPRIRITHLKLFADGALGSRGAALTHGYADDPGTQGVPRMTTAEIAGMARRALDAGLGVAAHAIGDEAVKRVLDGYQLVLQERPGLDPSRLRIEHFSYAREADLARAVRLGIVLSIQSNFNSAIGDDPPFGTSRVGPANEPRVYAWARLVRLGARLAEGSDYFARPAEPLSGYYAALTRRNAVGTGWSDPEARLIAYRMQATRFPPMGSPTGGVIRPEAPADLVVLSGDPLRASRDDILRIRVLATVNAGRITYADTAWLAAGRPRR